MNIHSFICTRSRKLTPTTNNLIEYLKKLGSVNLLVAQSSIFEGYSKILEKTGLTEDSIIILCHDDIELYTEPKKTRELLISKLIKSDTGFVGVAGTKRLLEDAVWWNQSNRVSNLLSGCVHHGSQLEGSLTSFYGEYGEVVVLDGVFMATTLKTLRKIGVNKPETFKGDWDFYDLLFCMRARALKLKNYTIPLQILHNSRGEIVGRDSWLQNREAFIKLFKLPVSCN